ncbi:hypothetical protein [uncultured Algibacter sp.]|uniref:hypothetical protein n=1 Tax=uncultured Algibacter sp. TaxID=298659 RepID=UPI003216364F
MHGHQIKYFFLVLVLAVFCSRCTKPVDFDQANDLVIEPVVGSSIAFFNGKANDFNEGAQGSIVTDTVSIDVFGNNFVQDNLVKAELIFELTNSINRGYSLQVDFLDAMGLENQSLTFTVPASPSNVPVLTTFTEVFEDMALVDLKNTEFLIFTLTMLPGQPITQDSLGEINLQSKGVFFLLVNT